MHLWHNLSPIATGNPCTAIKPSNRGVRRSSSHDGDLSQRRRLRSSVGTAPLNHDHGTTTGSEAHTPLAMLPGPLSEGSCASYTPALRRQRSGSDTHTSTSTETSQQTHTFEYTNYTRKHARWDPSPQQTP
ncbi:hypothetical protein H2248_006613 [Termitomyces sp. 'cryptogamus']|nr:hypothetical protein H2248_006613 [Termitomyces sp. 'cryptogamus']